MNWAENEINICCKRAGENEDELFKEYMQECAFAALDAYELLMSQGHSGYSIGITMSLLNRLVEGKPLTPIENSDDMWTEGYASEEFGYKSFHCKRYPALHKKVYKNGNIVYSDCNRWRCYDARSDVPYSSGIVNNALEEMFPITFPYAPVQYKVNCETFLYDKSNGDFDHKAILTYIDDSGKEVTINRYFQETNEGWKEISPESYLDHKRISQGGGIHCGQS